ncbi:MAG: GNAT family N-acetyltransferase [Erysipelothrix sp.]
MIKLHDEHKTELIEFLNQDPYTNLFLVGDLLAFGFEDSIQRYYGFYENGKIECVLFRFRDDSLHVFGNLTEEVFETIEMFVKIESFPRIFMGEATWEQVRGEFDYLIQTDNISTLSVYCPNGVKKDDYEVKRLFSEDAHDCIQLMKHHFTGQPLTVEQYAKELDSQERVSYGIKVAGKLVSIASYVAKTADAAMIIGVCTDEHFQKRGYASAIVKLMSDDLYAEGRKGVLFYTNPVAARIYERLGYKPYARYHMIDLKRSEEN